MKLSYIYALLVALNLGGFPLVAGMSTLLGTGSTLASIAMRSLILGLSLLLIGLACTRQRVKFVRGPVWMLVLSFWSFYLGRIFVDTIVDPIDLSRDPIDYWIWAVGACLLPMLALLTYPNADYLKPAYRLSLTILVLAGLLTAALGSGMSNPTEGTGHQTGRLQLESLNPIFAGHMGLSLLLLAIWPMIHAPGARTTLVKFLHIPAGILGLFLLIAAASRGPFVGLLMVLLFYGIAYRAVRAWRLIPITILLVVGIAQFATYLEQAGSYRVVSRVESVTSGEDMAVTSRLVAYIGAIEQFAGSPIYGNALEEERTGFYPHNVILESFMATGLLGGLPFLALIFYGVLASYRLIERRSEHGWIPLIFIQYFIAAQFSGSLFTSTVMWTFLAIVIVSSQRVPQTTSGLSPEALTRLLTAHAKQQS